LTPVAPVAGRVMAQAIMGETLDVPLNAFSPGRFVAVQR
jgi:glycine/D-amino acid oxidase-like deaminating enzyme